MRTPWVVKVRFNSEHAEDAFMSQHDLRSIWGMKYFLGG